MKSAGQRLCFLRVSVVAACLLTTSVEFGTVMAESPFEHAVKIKELVQPLLESSIVRGISIGVIDHDRKWTQSYGTLSESDAATPDENTIYEIGSISKVFTGILLANEITAGEVSLDTSVGEIATSLTDSNPELANSVLLRHLATHSSGLPRMPTNWNPVDANQPYADYTRELMMAYLALAKLKSKPGAASGYSNYGVALLGELLAMKAGASYEQLLRQRITRPLAMTSTSIRVDDDNRSHVAPPHQPNGDGGDEWAFDAFAGAGGIHSTASDMLRFMDAHLHPLQDATQQPLAQAIELAWQQHLPATDDGVAMGLGWHFTRDGKTRWHSGHTDGYHCIVLMNREIACGVSVLCNTASGDIDALGKSILRVLAGESVASMTVSNLVLPADEIQRLVGNYVFKRDFVLNVTAKSDRLFVRATNQPQFRVFPSSLSEWSYRDVEGKLTFELPKAGSATALTLHQNGRDMKAMRQ